MKVFNFLIFLIFPFIFYAQFQINPPNGWMDYSSGNEEMANRITFWGSKLTDAIIENSDLNLKNFSELKYYTKYDMYSSKSKRSMPSIRVYLLKNYMNKSLNELKEYYLNDWKLMENKGIGYENVNIIESNIIKINNKEGIKFRTTFEFINPYLEIKEKHRSRIYYFFISENYYLQITMNDKEYDKCDMTFDRVLNKIKF